MWPNQLKKFPISLSFRDRIWSTCREGAARSVPPPNPPVCSRVNPTRYFRRASAHFFSCVYRENGAHRPDAACTLSQRRPGLPNNSVPHRKREGKNRRSGLLDSLTAEEAAAAPTSIQTHQYQDVHKHINALLKHAGKPELQWNGANACFRREAVRFLRAL